MPITKDQIAAAIDLEREVVRRLQPHDFDMGKAETKERRALAREVSKVRLDVLQKIQSSLGGA